jgi:hypothetical protein
MTANNYTGPRSASALTMERTRPLTCESCGIALATDAKYCQACGAGVTTGQLPPVILAGGWFVVGLLVAANLTLLLSFFPLVIITGPAAFLCWRAVGRRSGASQMPWAMAVGLAVLPFGLAYINRHGPGNYCHNIGSRRYPGTECGEYSDPLPYFVAGILLLASPLVGVPVTRRWTNRNTHTAP